MRRMESISGIVESKTSALAARTNKLRMSRRVRCSEGKEEQICFD